MHTWSDEELKLATGGEGINHMHHSFELVSAYLGIPVRFRVSVLDK